MEDREKSTSLKGEVDFGNAYFEGAYENSQRHFRGSEYPPERQGELIAIAEGAGELSPKELKEKFSLSSQEGYLVGFFMQIIREIDQGVVQGNLTAEEADQWRERFGLKGKEPMETEA
jgi:hypothetical protein